MSTEKKTKMSPEQTQAICRLFSVLSMVLPEIWTGV